MKILKWSLVVIFATILATLGINAFDNLDNPADSLVASILPSEPNNDPCPKDMVFVSTSDGGFCIDKYEASPGKECPYNDPRNKKETDNNLSGLNCKPVSVKDAVPWRNIARHQAELACSKAGKRLPANKEWYKAALGTVDKSSDWKSSDCNVDNSGSSDPKPTGAQEACVSSVMAYDMIGNVWEWVEETVYEGEYKGRSLPEQGYVADIDEEGVAIMTSSENFDSTFFNDYFWIDKTEVRGMFRGGSWTNQSDAGQYSLYAVSPPSYTGRAVGFRCVSDAN